MRSRLPPGSIKLSTDRNDSSLSIQVWECVLGTVSFRSDKVSSFKDRWLH